MPAEVEVDLRGGLRRRGAFVGEAFARRVEEAALAVVQCLTVPETERLGQPRAGVFDLTSGAGGQRLPDVVAEDLRVESTLVDMERIPGARQDEEAARGTR